MADLAVSRSIGGRQFGFTSNILKLIAALTMLCDHVGSYLFPSVTVLRVIGRMAFPIFAFFIAEGCRYTRHKLKRFLLVFGLAVLCEMAYGIVSGELTGTALVTFSCSIVMIYALQMFKASLTQGRVWRILLTLLLFAATVGGTCHVGSLIPMDYGVPGALLPVLLSALDYIPGKTPACFRYVDRHPVRMGVFAVGILAVWLFRRYKMGDIQIYGLLALLPMAFYNGQPGRRVFKYWFYIFFPAHLVVIWLIGYWMQH